MLATPGNRMKRRMGKMAARTGSDALRIVVFLVLLALLALHPALRHVLASLAGYAPRWPQECRLEDHGSILCLDEDGRGYRAR